MLHHLHYCPVTCGGLAVPQSALPYSVPVACETPLAAAAAWVRLGQTFQTSNRAKTCVIFQMAFFFFPVLRKSVFKRLSDWFLCPYFYGHLALEWLCGWFHHPPKHRLPLNTLSCPDALCQWKQGLLPHWLMKAISSCFGRDTPPPILMTWTGCSLSLLLFHVH